MNRFAAPILLFFLFFVGSDAFNVTVSYVPTSAACLSFSSEGLEYFFSIDQTPDGQYPDTYPGNTTFVCTLTTHGNTFPTFPSSTEGTNFNFSFPLVAGDMSVTCEDDDVYIPYFDLNITIPVSEEIPDDAVQLLYLTNECTNNSNGGSLTLVFPTSECPTTTSLSTNCSWYSWEYNGSPFFSPTLNITGASAGFYQLTMLSNLGYCQKTFNYTILPPPSSVVSIAISPNKTSCPSATGGDGSIIVTPYLDQINSSGTQIVPASWDLQIVNPDSGYNSSITIYSFPAEVPIDYHFQQVYVTGYPTGFSHCYATSATIIQDVLSMNATTQPSLSCANTGSITLLPSGGNSPYTGFGISGGALSSNSVSSGERTVGVIDANGCNVSMVVNVNTTDQAISMGEVLFDGPTCHEQENGQATLYNVTPLTNTNLTVDLRIGSPSSIVQSWTAVYGAISNFTGNSLAAGAYKFVVSDVCGDYQSILFNLTDPPPIIIYVDSTTPSLVCQSTGTLFTHATGEGPLTQLTPSTGLPGGLFTVMYTDGNNCTKTKTRNIQTTLPFAINSLVPSSPASCGQQGSVSFQISLLGNPGSVNISVLKAGVLVLQKNLVDLTYFKTITGLNVGSYRLTVNHPCWDDDKSFSIVNPFIAMNNIVVQPTTSCTSSGWIAGTVSSSQSLLGSYLVQVMLMSTGSVLTILPFDTPAWNVSGLGVGIYTVTVTSDNTGCVDR